MKRLANISVTLTALIILIFCGGGVCITKCACSGKVSLLLPNNVDCCPADGDCMTVTTLQVSDGDMTAGIGFPQVQAVMLPASGYSIVHCRPIPARDVATSPRDVAPPGVSQSMVMRV